MNDISVENLLDKYLAGSISEGERKLLYDLMEEPEQRKKLEAIIDNELLEHAWEGEENDKLLSSIQDNINNKIYKERPLKTVFVNFRRLAAAAVFLALVGTVVYMWNKPRKSLPGILTADQQPGIKKDWAPGSNRAVLQLSNGSQIVLDSISEGIVAQQGNVRIIKLGKGELAYRGDKTSAEDLYNVISTPRGGQYQVTLADGTKVWLNAASSLRFPASFHGKERNVTLTGEGYFEVAKNAAMPFHVKVNDMNVEVLGTHFNVNGYDDEGEMRTTLLEGKVKVSKKGQSGILVPGQQAAVNKTGELKIQAADTKEATSWKNGFFEFTNADIETVLRQAERWYNVEFERKGNIHVHFSGEISRKVNLSQLIQILESTGKAHFEIQEKKIIVTPQGKQS